MSATKEVKPASPAATLKSSAEVLPKGGDLSLKVRQINDTRLSTAVRINCVRDVMQARIGELQQCLPKHMSADRMIRVYLGAIRQNPKLLDCTPESLFSSILEAATLGLETDGILGHAYLVPYKNECQLQAGYRGLLDLVRRKGKVVVKTRCVYRGDEFDYSEGDDDYIRHKPNQSPDATFDTKDVSHVYLIAKDDTGSIICRNVWTRAQVEAHRRKYSKAQHKADNPWNTAWETMARKTLIRDSVARGELPVSAEVQRIAVREEVYEVSMSRPIDNGADDVFGLTERIVGNGARLETTAGTALPDDPPEVIGGEVVDPDDIPFGGNDDSEEEESSQEAASVVPASNFYLMSDRESPAKWEARILDAIRSSKNADMLEDVKTAVEIMVEQYAIKPDMGRRLTSHIDRRFEELTDH